MDAPEAGRGRRQPAWRPRRRRTSATLTAAALLVAACASGPAGSATAPPATAAPATAAPSPSVTDEPPASLVPAVDTVQSEIVFTGDTIFGTLLVTDDAIWAFELHGAVRIDPTTNAAMHLDLVAESGGGESFFGAVAYGSIWVSDFSLSEVRRFDMSGTLIETIETPSPAGILASDGAIWVADHRSGSVSRIDPATNAIVATVVVGSTGRRGPERLIAADDRIWVGNPRDGTIVGIDPATNTSVGTIPVAPPGNPCGDIASFGDRLYVSGCAVVAALSVVDIATMTAVGSPDMPGNVTGPVAVGSALWFGVAAASGSTLSSLDPDTLALGRGVAVTGGIPTILAVGFDSMWVAVENEPAHVAWILRVPLASFR